MVDSWEMKGQHICEGRSIAKGTKTTTPRFKLKIQGKLHVFVFSRSKSNLDILTEQVLKLYL